MWLRLRQIALVAHQLEPVLQDFHAVLGIEPAFRDPGVISFGLENAVMPVGNQFVEVVAPVRDGTAAGRYLDRRKGDGGYMVITQCDDHPPVKQRVEALGIRKALEFDHDAYHCLQLHPADTGGSFLEIDQQVGGEDIVDGPWEPAGPNWQHARRTDVVSGVAAAELQVAEPDKVAARWGEIVAIEPASAADGHPTLTLDNATVRFVAAADGRGDGLGGIDVTAVDADAARAAAEARGLLGADGTITICGLRIRLV